MEDLADIADIVQDFLVESREGLDQYDRDLLELERDPASAELLSALFRVVHTIKGTTGFLPFRRLEAVAHAAESLLAQIRRGGVQTSRDVVDALLEVADAMRAMFGSIEASGTEGDESYVDLVARLDRLTWPDAEEPAARVVADEPVHEAQDPSRRRNAEDPTIRVDVTLLDSLMNLVGELVLTRNQVVQRVGTGADADLRNVSQRLALLTTELQDGIMQARLQPIDTVWRSLPRLVRDLAGQLGKSVRLEMHGRDVDLDRTILEAIKDPLTHMVRNAVDHGIEPPEERVLAGKPAEGLLVLRAYHEGGLVTIELTDDGAGIDPEQLRRVGVRRGVVTAEAAEHLHGRDLLDVVFRPGFSTAGQVTNVSGRGVGMDVVRTNIEKIGGTVDLDSSLRQGTSLRVRIPLTLAIIPALLVRSGGQRFALPQNNVRELVRVDVGGGPGGVEHVHGAPVYRLRDRLLPLLDLRRQLDQPEAAEPPRNVVVLQVEHRRFGLLVDGVAGTEEIVVKPTGHQLRDLDVYAGATTLGDGGLALILDVAALARRGGVFSVDDDEPDAGADQATGDHDSAGTQVLVVHLCDGGPLAVPLSGVRRLEELPAAAVDHLGSQLVVNYRGGLLPLVRAEQAVRAGLSASGPADEAAVPSGGGAPLPERLTVVVCRVEDVTVGLLVDRIGEIAAAEPLTRRARDGQAPAEAPVVVAGHVTRQLDLQELVLAVDPHLLGHTTAVEALR